MSKPIKQWLRQNLKFSKKDRNAIIVLCALILFAETFNIVLNNFQPEAVFDYSEYEKLLEEHKKGESERKEMGKVLFPFDPNILPDHKMDSLLIPEFIKRNIKSYRNAGGKFKTKDDLRKIYGMNDSIYKKIEQYILIPEKRTIEESDNKTIPEMVISGFFDPNHSSLEDLTKFGFNSFQANNVLEYRKKGGTFSSPADLLKIYGIDSLFFSKIEEYIQIETHNEPIAAVKEEQIKIDINSADSAQFVQLNGVGPVFASRILKYRDMLGGFVSKSQLLEVYNFPEETFNDVKDNLNIDTFNLKKLRLNFSDFSDLIRHPYLNEENVKSIIEFRNQNGAYLKVDQILKEGLVDSATYFSIAPYLNTR